MPTFTYQCGSCKRKEDLVARIGQAPDWVSCDKCSAKAVGLVHMVRIIEVAPIGIVRNPAAPRRVKG